MANRNEIQNNMKAIRKDFHFEIQVRKMNKDEMPDDGITYYCDDETNIIYEENELEFTKENKNE